MNEVEKMSLKKLSEAIGAKCRGDSEVSGVCIDTRKLKKGDLFVAIKGERVDGHDLIEQAFSLGASGAVSTHDIEGYDNIIIVEDTVKALMGLAKYYRSLFSVFTVGVTGSVGKTSTKEMIYTILNKAQKTLKTEGNFNNEIGLPLTVFELDSSYKNAVFEMGMSDFGEIKALAKICNPTIGVITNIGVSHIENLGSRENILKAKLEMVDEMPHDAPLVLNADDDMLCDVGGKIEHPIIYYGIENTADVTARDISQRGIETQFTISFYGKEIRASIPTIGRHNVYNALAAFCVGVIAQMKPEDIVSAMQHYHNYGMRQNISILNGITIIADCYNASPNSMEAAIDVITNIECEGKRMCVFGDMLELGDISEEAHLEVGRQVARTRVDMLICYGEGGKIIKRGAVMVGMKNVIHFQTKKEIALYLAENLQSGDAVVFKASRGVALENIIDDLRECLGISDS